MILDSMRSLASSNAAVGLTLEWDLLDLDLLLDLLDLDLDLVLRLKGDRLLCLPPKPKGDLDLDCEVLYSPEYSPSESSSNLP